MTIKQAQKFMAETGTKPLITSIVERFNGENYNDVKKFLSVASFYLLSNCYVDADLAKSHIEFDEEGDDDA